MSNVISTRMEKKEIEVLNQISAKEHIDRSALIRKFLLQQIKEYKMKEFSEKYRKGLTSLAETATLANVSIYEMMEFCQKELISPPSPSDEILEKERNDAKDIFQKIANGEQK